MNQTENLLVNIAEECAEIQEAVAKALRFGLKNHHPDDTSGDVTSMNNYHIYKEYLQLSYLIRQAVSLGILPFLSPGEVEKIKSEKASSFFFWLRASVAEGTVEKDTQLQNS